MDWTEKYEWGPQPRHPSEWLGSQPPPPRTADFLVNLVEGENPRETDKRERLRQDNAFYRECSWKIWSSAFAQNMPIETLQELYDRYEWY